MTRPGTGLRSVLSSAVVAVAAVVLVALAAPGAAGAAKARLAYELPDYTEVSSLAVGPEGVAWITGGFNIWKPGKPAGRYIDRLGPGGQVSEMPLAQDEYATAPAITADGEAWFVIFHGAGDRAEVVGFGAGGRGGGFVIGHRVTRIESMVAVGGELWFDGEAKVGGSVRATLGRIAVATGGAVRLHPLRPGCEVGELGGSPKGAWFGERCGERTSVVRIDPSGRLHRRPIAAGGLPTRVSIGPEGAAWFAVGSERSEASETVLVRVGPGGRVAEYPVPGAQPVAGIAVGGNGRLWFRLGSRARRLASIDPPGDVRGPIAVGGWFGPADLTSAPGGEVWFSGYPRPSPPDLESGGGALLEEEEARERRPATIWQLGG